jgi:hypothetical protein
VRAYGVAATSKLAEEAALECLADRGTAADAVAAAFFALAGARPDVLAAPTTLLVAGASAVGRFFDGRAAQPGAGGSRARGIAPDAAVPLAARAAAPRAVGAVLLMKASFGSLDVSRAIGVGVRAARDAGDADRRRTLERVLAHGGRALASLAEPVLARVGRTAGGAFTEADLTAEATQSEAARAHLQARDGSKLVVADEPHVGASLSDVGRERELCAVIDARGMIATMAIHVGHTTFDGASLEVPGLGIQLPLTAVLPVRERARVAPGTVLLAPPSWRTVDAGSGGRAAFSFAAVPPVPHEHGATLTEALVSLAEGSDVSLLATRRGVGRFLASDLWASDEPPRDA